MTPRSDLLNKVWGCKNCYYKDACKDAHKNVACGSHAQVKYQAVRTTSHSPHRH